MDCTNSLARISVRMDKEIEAGHTTLHELIED
jgi:hypothetical protein